MIENQNSRVCVCVFVCVCIYPPGTQKKKRLFWILYFFMSLQNGKITILKNYILFIYYAMSSVKDTRNKKMT